MSAKAFLKGVETWKKETTTKVVKFGAQRLNSLDSFMLIESNFLLCLALLVLILQEAAKRLELDSEWIYSFFFLHFSFSKFIIPKII